MEQSVNTKCPICKKKSDPHYRPFCSKRCKDVDLHHWIQGVYTLETDETEEEHNNQET